MPIPDPRIRPSALTLWAAPKMTPCLFGSLRRDSREFRFGCMNDTPVTMTANDPSNRATEAQLMATTMMTNPTTLTAAPKVANLPSAILPAKRRTSPPWIAARVKPMYA